MALPPQNDDAFFRQVDEDLRRDRMIGFFTRWGRWLAAAIGLFLLALALGLWWRSHREAQAGLASEAMNQPLAAMEEGRAPGDVAGLAQVAQSPRDGYRAIARMTQAAAFLQQNKLAEAAGAYVAIANDSGLPQPVRDLALLRGTTLQFDSLPSATIVDRLKGLAVVGNPWFGSAAEVTALAWLKLGRKDRAGPLFAAIVRDPDAPASLRGRAAGMATSLGQVVAPITGPASPKE